MFFKGGANKKGLKITCEFLVAVVDEHELVFVVSPMHHGIKPDGESGINLYGWIKTSIKGRKVNAKGG